jgi:hypothetical protein
MRLVIDVSRVSFSVGREVQPRLDQTSGVQRRDKVTGLPMWTVQLVAMDEGGAEVINVTVVAPEAPKLSVGQPVAPVALEAIPWAQNGKNGTAFRAAELRSANLKAA